MSTVEMTATRPAGRVPLAVRATQVLMTGPLGALVVFGSIYFSVIAPEENVAGVDWLVGAWALAWGVANLYVGLRLAARPALRRTAIALVACHLVFGLVKVVGYDEAEAATFMAVDVVALLLLVLWSPRR